MSHELKALAARIGGTYITASSEADAADAPAKEGSIQWIMNYIKHNTGLGDEDISYSRQEGGYKIETAGGNRDISPHLPLKRLMEWASAFVKGYDAAKGRL